MPFLSQEHQQQVAQAVERAKQVTMTELNAIIGVRGLPNLPLTQQQLQAQHLSHATHGPPVQLPPHPSGLQPPGIPPVTGSSSGLLALGALGSQAHLTVKDEKNHHELDHRGAAWSWDWGKRAGLGWRQGSCIGGPRKCCLSPYDQELANDLEFLVQGN
uniref:TLE family member 3, transcriptional corepressor n=1 Tax=Rousettus aegyptiacus TaxID=9407 RepID=A0A7J8ITI1_ROUAE|nr:TLE family member 3, transcriptional corepressor [Rousettus aegyptiacus]